MESAYDKVPAVSIVMVSIHTRFAGHELIVRDVTFPIAVELDVDDALPAAMKAFVPACERFRRDWTFLRAGRAKVLAEFSTANEVQLVSTARYMPRRWRRIRIAVA